MPRQYLDGDGFAHYESENKKKTTGTQIAQASIASAVTRISDRLTKAESKSMGTNAEERLATLESAGESAEERLTTLESAVAEIAEAEAHPDRLYMYVPCQRWTSGSADPSGTIAQYSRECIVLRQRETVIMVDTGGAYSVSLIRNFLNSIGVDHVDYLVITHYHVDHSSGFSGLVGSSMGADQNYPDSLPQHIDFSSCRVFLPIPCHEIDSSSNLASEADSFFMDKLEELGLEPEYPDELDTLVINDNLKLTFYNCGRQALTEIMDITHEVNGQTSVTNINDCSMCCLVQHGDATIALTGDLSKGGEIRLARKYQRLLTRTVTPGVLNPVPASGAVPGGTLLTWDADFVPAASDGVGPLISAESFYRKLFHPDVYKVGHHAQNQTGAHTCDEYYAMLNPKAAFVIGTFNRDGAAVGGSYYESNAALLGCPVYSAGIDDLKFVSDGVVVSCVYGSLDWTGGTRKLLHTGSTITLYPASDSTIAPGQHAVWARVAFQTRERPFALCVYVSSISGPDAGSAIIEYVFAQDAEGAVVAADSRCRIVNASAGFAGVFGMVHEGEGLVNLTVQKVSGVVWAATVLSANYAESAIVGSPVYSRSYSQAAINNLAAPKWYKAAAA